MKKKFHVITGLPRSGSTLLTTILNQNPKFHASNTSGLPRLLTDIRNAWENYPEHNANFNLERKLNVLNSVVDGYYADRKEQVIFDKSRVWSSEPELAEKLFGEDSLYIVTVRDIPEILASFENLYRKNAHIWTTIDKKNSPAQANTIAGRCELWASNSGPVGSAIITLRDLNLKNKEVFLIEYKDLVENPEIKIKQLYERLGEKLFDHDFKKIIQKDKEDDVAHGILGLHDVGKEIKKSPTNPIETLGIELVKKYSGAEFWR